jgi:hypothetical protein
MITQAVLKERLEYNPGTGVFTHLTNTTHKKKGDVAGFTHSKGYVHVCCAGKEYKAHRLAYLYMMGYMPEEVDHEDRVKDNNKWSNLRESDRVLNTNNVGVRKDNTTGVRGLSFDKRGKKHWTYRRQYNGKQETYSFYTKEEALIHRKLQQFKDY